MWFNHRYFQIFSLYFSDFANVEVAENAEEKISIQLLNNKYFCGTFNSKFSLQNKQLQHLESKPKNLKEAKNPFKILKENLF